MKIFRNIGQNIIINVNFSKIEHNFNKTIYISFISITNIKYISSKLSNIKEEYYMKKLSILIICNIVISTFGAVSLANDPNNSNFETSVWTHEMKFSQPTTTEFENSYKLELKEANNKLNYPNTPEIPCYDITKTFPLGTNIVSITCNHVTSEIISLNKPLKYSSTSQTIEEQVFFELTKNHHLFKTNQYYPNKLFSYDVGGGLYNGEHATILKIQFYPIRYNEEEKILEYVKEVEFSVNVEKPIFESCTSSEYSLVIIGPSDFTSNIQPLVNHKTSYGVSTKLVSLDDIYSSKYFPTIGKDDGEQIKYFIKDALEQWGTKYILLFGSIYKIPIRTTWIRSRTVLTDLYYSDLYFSDKSFCSWDSNNNGYYGEYWHENETDDDLDLYPDIYVGRLPCDTKEEVEIVVDKIMQYEQQTYGKEWFNRIILIGGDTHPGYGVNEGEFTIGIIENLMQSFIPIKLLTSDNTFKPKNLNDAINNGAGFVCYAGHGFENGMGTYKPNGNTLQFYFSPNIIFLKNNYKLPVIFFDACLTAKLDFVLQDLLNYKDYRIFDLLAKIFNFDTQIKLPVFAWCFVKHKGGGAIATIGATRVAYGMVDQTGVHGGAGYLALKFFESYENGTSLGEMYVTAQINFLKEIPYRDVFTVEEFILLGDPSLKLGGYN